MKHIMALPTCQEICLGKEVEEPEKFDLGHLDIAAKRMKEFISGIFSMIKQVT